MVLAPGLLSLKNLKPHWMHQLTACPILVCDPRFPLLSSSAGPCQVPSWPHNTRWKAGLCGRWSRGHLGLVCDITMPHWTTMRRRVEWTSWGWSGGGNLCVHGCRSGQKRGAGVRANISGRVCVCLCVDKSKAGTNGQKQNIACRHTIGGGGA